MSIATTIALCLSLVTAEIKAGDKVVTLTTAPVMSGEEKVAEVGPGVELTVTDVKLPWYGVTVIQDGKEVTGWVVNSKLMAERRRSPTEFTNSIDMKFKLIPAGEFMMGSPEGEKNREDCEQQHRVRITKPFYLGTTEVTQGQWEQVMGSRPWSGSRYVMEGSGYAATYISWDDAVKFCGKLSEQEGLEYRLPTEAEWEYACRAGTTTAYSFGNDWSDLSDYAWWGSIHVNGTTWNEPYAHQVGQKRPNAWGLYDMLGNAFEWCQDRYSKTYYGNSPTDDPTGPTTGSERVLRGGSWLNYNFFRSAHRHGYTPDYRPYLLGFRLVLVPSE